MGALRGLEHTVKDACWSLGISTGGYYSATKPKDKIREVPEIRDLDLLGKIKAVKLEHPFWRYRRVWAWLTHREKVMVNLKKVRRIMKENDLMASQTVHKARRTLQRNKPRAD